MLGKRLVYSVTYLDEDEKIVSRLQNVGEITYADDEYIQVTHDDGTTFELPPGEPETVQLGSVFTLKDGRKIESPDFSVRYTVLPGDEEDEESGD